MSLRKSIKKIKSLDAFPKLEAVSVASTGSGGLLTLIISCLLGYLVVHEIVIFMTITQKYEFLVDPTRSQDHSLQINIDLTVKSKCDVLRADVLDSAGETITLNEKISKTPVVWGTKGSKKLDSVVFTNEEKMNVKKLIKHAMRDKRAKMAYPNIKTLKPVNDNVGCRFVGAFNVNKVTGMVHITALGHGYFGRHTEHQNMNFTHKIDKLSFGKHFPGLENPLDHSLELTMNHMERFQYFLAVVPTIFVDSTGTFTDSFLLTNQYAVTEFKKDLDPAKGQTGGTPGIFLRYEIEPISVRITENKQSFSHFIARLCSIIGGIFVTSGVVLDISRLAIGAVRGNKPASRYEKPRD